MSMHVLGMQKSQNHITRDFWDSSYIIGSQFVLKKPLWYDFGFDIFAFPKLIKTYIYSSVHFSRFISNLLITILASSAKCSIVMDWVPETLDFGSAVELFFIFWLIFAIPYLMMENHQIWVMTKIGQKMRKNLI